MPQNERSSQSGSQDKQPDLSGGWHCRTRHKSGNTQDNTMHLKQEGWQLTGDIRVRTVNPDGSLARGRTYLAQGEIVGGLLLLNARCNGVRPQPGVHTALLAIAGDAQTLRGPGLFFSMTLRKISSTNYVWQRRGSVSHSETKRVR